jgi:hypothetical protein
MTTAGEFMAASRTGDDRERTVAEYILEADRCELEADRAALAQEALAWQELADRWRALAASLRPKK